MHLEYLIIWLMQSKIEINLGRISSYKSWFPLLGNVGDPENEIKIISINRIYSTYNNNNIPAT